MKDRRLLFTVALGSAALLAAVVAVSGVAGAIDPPVAGILGLVLLAPIVAAIAMLYRSPALRVPTQRRLSERLMDFVSAEDLAGLETRVAFVSAAQREIARCARYNHRFALLLWNLTEFEEQNDPTGQMAGKQVVSVFAEALHTALRASDFGARLGTGEFGAILIESGAEGVEAVRNRVQEVVLSAWQGSGLAAAFGAAVYPDDGTTLDELLRVADPQHEPARGTGRLGHSSSIGGLQSSASG